jgi:glycine cleavage system H lipoate-binding protein
MNFMATKGTEYLLIIGYLAALIPLAMLLRPRRVGAAHRPIGELVGSWFEVPEGLRFHPGHTWAALEPDGVVRIGLDDFAARLLGTPSRVHMPWRGSQIESGESAFRVEVDGETFPILSPVRGQVVEINDAALRAPELIGNDPYGAGWLMKIRVPRASASLKTLLSDTLARVWMRQTQDQLSGLIGQELGVVMQDGGVPVRGFIKEFGKDRWKEVAHRLLLS